MPVVVVTDSSARLPDALRRQWAIRQVPLHVLLDATDLRDGVDDIPDNIHDYGNATTAAATPAELADVYRRALEDSGGKRSRQRPREVHRHYPVAAAAVSRNYAFIVVHQLDNLRRSGRIGGAGAWLGTKLSLKPLLRIDDGKLVLAQRVRTTTKATATMIDRVCDVVGERSASIAVHHVANSQGAADLAGALAERLPALEPAIVTDLGPILALHLGAGALAVCLELAVDADPPTRA
jgi:fatty acid-binding protein DegV